MNRCFTAFAVVCALMLPISVSAHAGGTDSQGGHWDHGSGTYHFHHGYPAHSHVDQDGDGVLDCPYNFEDNTANASGNTGGGTGGAVSLSYTEGYNKGHAQGYKEGYTKGKEDGYSSGQRDLRLQLEREYNEKLESEKSEHGWSVVIAILIAGSPVLIGVHLFLCERKLEKERERHEEEKRKIKEDMRQSQNMAILKRISPGTEEYVKLPAGVQLDLKCIPVKGFVTEARPFGDYTVYVSANGSCYHRKESCCKGARPVHLFSLPGKIEACKTCTRNWPHESIVPEWYRQIKNGNTSDKKEKS